MNKKYSYIFLLLCVCLTGCFKDETTDGNLSVLTEIKIDPTSVDSVYNILGNDSLVISPKVTQTGGEKLLKYEWEVDQKVVSTEKEFHYVADELGSFQCRFIVSNEDGKSFFPFVINVNTAYEEGLTVLSQATDGSSCLSFMLTNTDGSASEFYDEECFSRNNPDIPFAPGAVDMVHTENSLYILCKGSETEPPAIYNLQHKTLKMKNYINVTSFDGFVPSSFMLPARPYPGNHYPIICENGRTYDFGSENVVGLPTKLKSTYARKALMFDSRTNYYYYSIFWDTEAGGLGMLYTGYGPFYASSVYNCSRDSVVMNPSKYNYFSGDEFVTMARTFVTKDKSANQDPEIVVLTKRAVGPLVNLKRTVLNYAFWVRNDEGENVLSVSSPTKVCATATPGQSLPIDINTPMIVSKTYNALFYGSGNSIMKWNYITDMLAKSTALVSVGKSGDVITGLLLSDDQQSMYVSFYSPAQSGKNGSVWLVNTDDGRILEKHDNVCFRPVKMIYKEK